MIFLDAMAAYLVAWATAFGRPARELAPLTPARMLVLFLFPLFLLLQLFHWLCLALDELLFPAYRRTRLDRPVFILGVPRSGTTFLHRELAQNESFTAPRSWELVVAPAICQRRLIALFAAADAAVGAPLRNSIEWVLRRIDGGVSDVHPIGLDEAEEDYLALLPAAGCFFTLLCFPHAARFRALGLLESLDETRRERLLAHYKRLLQRHVYANGHRQLLSKNAAFAAWAPFLRDCYPDALFVLCIRDPGAALQSQLKSLEGARTLFASLPADQHIEELFGDLHDRWWHALEIFASRQALEPLVIEQEWMRGHTDAVLELVQQRLSQPSPTPPGKSPAAGRRSAPEAARSSVPRETATGAARRHTEAPDDALQAFLRLRERAMRQRGALTEGVA